MLYPNLNTESRRVLRGVTQRLYNINLQTECFISTLSDFKVLKLYTF
jgi:hypothetical protein